MGPRAPKTSAAKKSTTKGSKPAGKSKLKKLEQMAGEQKKMLKAMKKGGSSLAGKLAKVKTQAASVARGAKGETKALDKMAVSQKKKLKMIKAGKTLKALAKTNAPKKKKKLMKKAGKALKALAKMDASQKKKLKIM